MNKNLKVNKYTSLNLIKLAHRHNLNLYFEILIQLFTFKYGATKCVKA